MTGRTESIDLATITLGPLKIMMINIPHAATKLRDGASGHWKYLAIMGVNCTSHLPSCRNLRVSFIKFCCIRSAL